MCHEKILEVDYFLKRVQRINSYINMSYINRDYNGTDLRLPLVNVVILSNSPHYKTLSHLASVTEKWLP